MSQPAPLSPNWNWGHYEDIHDFWGLFFFIKGANSVARGNLTSSIHPIWNQAGSLKHRASSHHFNATDKVWKSRSLPDCDSSDSDLVSFRIEWISSFYFCLISVNILLICLYTNLKDYVAVFGCLRSNEDLMKSLNLNKCTVNPLSKGSRMAEWLARLLSDQKVWDSIPGSNPLCSCHCGCSNSHIQPLEVYFHCFKSRLSDET